MLIRLVKPLVLSPFVSQRLRRYVSTPNRADLEFLLKLWQSRTLRPVVDRTYALHETPDALRYIDNGHARGKVVIDLQSA